MGSIFRALSWTTNQGKGWKFLQKEFNTSSHNSRSGSYAGYIRHHKPRTKSLFSSSIVLQDGNFFIEMPCIVQVINGRFEITSNGKTDSGEDFIGLGLQCLPDPKATSKKVNFTDELTTLLDLFQCETIEDICRSLSIWPDESVTPFVALYTIEAIFELDCIDLKTSKRLPRGRVAFARSALLKHLVEKICTFGSPAIILKTLKALLCDPYRNHKCLPNYRKPLCTACIILASEQKLSLGQTCQMVRDFHYLGDIASQYIDSVWVGINTNIICEEDLVQIVNILPYVQSSRPYLYNIIENQFTRLLPWLQSGHISQIISPLKEMGRLENHKILPLFCKWITLNSHEVAEECLSQVVELFTIFEYTDQSIQHQIHCFLHQISSYDPMFLIILLKYFTKLRIRNPIILQLMSDYFLLHPETLKAYHVLHFVRCFGHLNFIPEYSKGFCTTLESLISSNFNDFSPSDLVDILIHCLYLGCYPSGPIDKILASGYLDIFLRNCHVEDLLILDTIRKLDSQKDAVLDYSDKVSPGIIDRDSEIDSCRDKVEPFLRMITGSEGEVHKSVVLPSLPNISLFRIDFVITMRTSNFDKCEPETKKVALLIHRPEDFDITGKFLLGRQALQKRTIEKCGYEMVSLNYRTLIGLLQQRDTLNEYLQEKLAKWLRCVSS